MTDREELAWAAGFIDGEGTFGMYNKHGRGKPIRSIHFDVCQSNDTQEPSPLLTRFHVLFPFAHLARAYRPSGRKPHWRVEVNNRDHFIEIAATLWEFLGPVKRGQIIAALAKYGAMQPTRENLNASQ